MRRSTFEDTGLRWREPSWMFWRRKTNYWYHRFKLAYNGRRKWRKDAKQFRITTRTLTLLLNRQNRRYNDADLKRVGWKFLVTVLLGVIAILLLK